MKFSRRKFLQVAAGAAALPPVSRVAWAQAYPSRPLRLIVGYPAGGPSDIIARLIGPPLSERLGQPVIIENRAGAAGNIATEAVVRAPADGYTLLMINATHTINANLYKLSFDFIRDIAPIATIYHQPHVLEVNPAVAVKTVPELIAYSRANPGKLKMASAGTGTSHHLAGELFKLMAGVDMLHVPYRGAAPAITDLIGGQVQVLFDVVSSSIEHIKSGRLRALAVTSPVRAEILPEIPTVNDFLPGYDMRGWQGVGAPRNTPVEIISRLNTEINGVLHEPRLRAKIFDLGSTPLSMTPSEFGKFIADETAKMAKLVKSADIKVE